MPERKENTNVNQNERPRVTFVIIRGHGFFQRGGRSENFDGGGANFPKNEVDFRPKFFVKKDGF